MITRQKTVALDHILISLVLCMMLLIESWQAQPPLGQHGWSITFPNRVSLAMWLRPCHTKALM